MCIQIVIYAVGWVTLLLHFYNQPTFVNSYCRLDVYPHVTNFGDPPIRTRTNKLRTPDLGWREKKRLVGCTPVARGSPRGGLRGLTTVKSSRTE